MIQIQPPIPGPGGCTAGWNDDPCPGEAEPGCEIDGYPACRECFDGHRSNACDTDPLVRP